MNCHVKFLNHSSVILTSDKTKILCDPWFNGSAFMDGWSLLHDRSHDINNLSFDYIWISHEHPDHFSIPTLSQLKTSKTFLYQQTKDKKVKHFLEKKGHKVIELPNKKTLQLNDLLITSVECDGHDASLITKFPNGKVVININDARVNLDKHLENEIIPLLKGEDLDLLMFQFSYANWAGNKDDNLTPHYHQKAVDKKNEYAIDLLKPNKIMPFASFIYFSHEENFYWNNKFWINHVLKIFSQKKSKLIMPLPNQIVDLNDIVSYDFIQSNNDARDFWLKKIKNIKVLSKSKTVSLTELKINYKEFIKDLHKKNPIFSKLETDKNFIISIKINDLDLTLTIGLLKHYFVIEKTVSNYCAELSSETFCFLMKNSFGRGTIVVNSRARFNYEYAHQFFLFFFIFYANNIGKYFDEFSNISYNLLSSVSRTSVMSSILHYNNNAKKNLHLDATFLSSLFSKVKFNNDDLDKFNEEPSNNKLD